MSTARPSILAPVLLAIGAIVVLSWRSNSRPRRGRVEEVNRWENEGGNVPEVALETGNQGKTPPVDSHLHAAATATNEGEKWQFPRS